MPHSIELIEKVRRIVERDYPPSMYRFEIEKAIPNTRMYPDILVRNLSDKIVCAVEIGYTRPEKLTAYRDKHKIPDVRWYDKQGNLHADVKEVSIALTISAEPARALSVYRLHGIVACPACYDNSMTDEIEDDDDWAYFFDLAYEEVTTIFLTDFLKTWFVSGCNACGETWIADENDELDTDTIIDNLERLSGTEFARRYAPMVGVMSWDESVKYVKDEMEMEIKFVDSPIVVLPAVADLGVDVVQTEREYLPAFLLNTIQIVNDTAQDLEQIPLDFRHSLRA